MNRPEPAPLGGVAEAWPADAVEVGRVVGAWGVKGWIRVQPYAADPQALFASKRWYVQPSPGPRPAGAAALPGLLRISLAREHGEGVVASVHDITDRTQAEALRGARLFISRASFPTPDDGEFYWVDLIGATVVNRDGVELGVVSDLIDTGPHCVLQVQRAAGNAHEGVDAGAGAGADAVLPASTSPGAPSAVMSAATVAATAAAADVPAPRRRRRPGAAASGPADILIPFVEAYIGRVDVPGRRIEVDWGADD